MNKNRKETNFRIKLISTLDRSITTVAYIKQKPLQFALLYSKTTSALQFQLDTGNSLIQNRRIHASMYRNLENCKFCQTFFHLKTEQNNKNDFRSKFISTRKIFNNDLLEFSSEKLDLQADGGKAFNNYVLTLGWKLHGLEDDLVFYFVQRRCYHTVDRKNVIRTSGLQLATDRGLDALDKFYDKNINVIEKVSCVPFLQGD